MNIFEIMDNTLYNNRVLCSGPAQDSKIEDLIDFFGPIPEDYRYFLGRYGAAVVGSYRVYGFGQPEAMGSKESSVIDVTNRMRSMGWPKTSNALVISIDHSGNPIMLCNDGSVICLDHDTIDCIMNFHDFTEFLKYCYFN